MDRHVTEVIRSCKYYTRSLRHIRPLLTLEAAKMISHGIVTARLDYCNSLSHGTSVRNLNRLQVTQNEQTRAVCRAPRSASATELRRQLHWLPERQRIDYKLALLTYKTRSTGTPAHLASLLEIHRPARTLRSSNNNLLTVPSLSLAFCVSGPTAWNSLPNSCKQAELVTTFKRKLKSELFYLAYGEQPIVYGV